MSILFQKFQASSNILTVYYYYYSFFLSYIQVLFISEEMNKHGFVPKMPSQADLELIFDTSYQDVQPYLFKISHATSMPTSPSMGTAVRRLIRDTLTLS